MGALFAFLGGGGRIALTKGHGPALAAYCDSSDHRGGNCPQGARLVDVRASADHEVKARTAARVIQVARTRRTRHGAAIDQDLPHYSATHALRRLLLLSKILLFFPF